MKNGLQFNDTELVNALRRNEHTDYAIKFLYGEYFESLSSLITFNSGTPEDAQDIFQEVVVSFIELVRNNKFREEATVKTFLYALTRNTWLNELKKRGRMNRRNKVFEESREHPDMPISEGIEDREMKKEFLGMLDKL